MPQYEWSANLKSNLNYQILILYAPNLHSLQAIPNRKSWESKLNEHVYSSNKDSVFIGRINRQTERRVHVYTYRKRRHQDTRSFKNKLEMRANAQRFRPAS